MKSLLAAMFLCASAYAQTNEVQPLVEPPKLHITTASVLAPATNALNIVAPRLELAGVVLVHLDRTVDRGATAVEWVLVEPTIRRQLVFRVGPTIVMDNLWRTHAGISTTVSIVRDSKLESWLTQTQPFSYIGKLVRWSNLYGFAGVVSRVDEFAPAVAVGGGVKVW